MKTLRRISKSRAFTHIRILAVVLFVVAAVALAFLTVSPPASAQRNARPQPLTPKFSTAVAFDVSPAVRNLPPAARPLIFDPNRIVEVRPERGPEGPKAHGVKPYSADGALQLFSPAPAIPAPLLTFEGLSNANNLALYGFRVAPPDPDGDVGPNHYVEMINLVFAVYDKQGNRLTGPTKLGDLWAGFAINDCTDPSGDPIVVYDQLENRWLLTQFTTRGPEFFNCVAISTSGDPTGSYFRYAFSTGVNFPDYPKYGNWKKSYVITTREFGPTVEYGIGVYALEKNKMIAGNPNARMVRFFIDGNVPANLPLVGDGLLPADIDGTRQPKEDAAIPIVGTQDDNASYGATFDALNIWELEIKWKANPEASLTLAAQLPTAPFDSIFPCTGPQGRNCIPQPGTAVGLDILSYRQRPTWRLAYRNFGTYETLVTNQSVEALPGVAGVRWYEIRRINGAYSLYQQGTYAPNDGVHRWMGSIAMDKNGNMALGYSVSNATTVFPGIRYTGRLNGDALGEMTLGEGVIINGSGSQLTTGSRWGDYTSMNIDPTDNCTFWYVNEYYQITELAAFQTRIGSFKLPGCQ